MAFIKAPIQDQFMDALGFPLDGGKLYVYSTGTTTAVNTYRDSDGETLNTNPIVLDARGSFKCFVDGTVALDYILYDKDSVLVDSFVGIRAGSFTDAPSDGHLYGRKNGNWAQVASNLTVDGTTLELSDD